MKPFDVDELLARVRAALRRRPEVENLSAVVQVGDVTIDLARSTVTRAGQAIHLTPTEFRFLEVLIKSDGRLLTYSQAAKELPASRGGELDQKAFRVFVGQLRQNLEDDPGKPALILTEPGVGYRLRD